MVWEDGVRERPSYPITWVERINLSTPGGEKNVGYDPGAAYESEAVYSLQAMPVQRPVADWTAASVTVLVKP